ncbi:sensor domain-containing diguanylate cyclase [Massilia endophytica]|uniref:sensor domain-containing diguanylate cyclase n=1 Tax=Massilia endophytica TaxID=2899220 RepID=UPI001E5D48B8|nr:sensor domain-containing diguanylate cyclase [Massilia endophytica]UGQ49065.1 sensor domain-containing diguanylate cyclase [Massilia endophytica]
MIDDFAAASQATMAFLRRRLGFKLWMVTRTEGDDWIVLFADDAGYGVSPGQVLRWSDSLCARMVMDQGPNIAPDVAKLPVYADAPLVNKLGVRAYVGIPLRRTDGSLFGTLCGFDPNPQPPDIREQLEMVTLLGDLLGSLLNTELNAADAARRAERAELDATRDALTGLYNRRGWEMLLQREEERCSRYGHSACLVSIDLDDLKFTNDTQGQAAGDALLMRAGKALQAVTRACDVVARLGGDEFGMLMVECDYFDAQTLLMRVQETLAAYDVRASLGMALRKAGYDLDEAFAMADAEMYRAKRSRKVLN